MLIEVVIAQLAAEQVSHPGAQVRQGNGTDGTSGHRSTRRGDHPGVLVPTLQVQRLHQDRFDYSTGAWAALIS